MRDKHNMQYQRKEHVSFIVILFLVSWSIIACLDQTTSILIKTFVKHELILSPLQFPVNVKNSQRDITLSDICDPNLLRPVPYLTLIKKEILHVPENYHLQIIDGCLNLLIQLPGLLQLAYFHLLPMSCQFISSSWFSCHYLSLSRLHSCLT